MLAWAFAVWDKFSQTRRQYWLKLSLGLGFLVFCFLPKILLLFGAMDLQDATFSFQPFSAITGFYVLLAASVAMMIYFYASNQKLFAYELINLAVVIAGLFALSNFLLDETYLIFSALHTRDAGLRFIGTVTGYFSDNISYLLHVIFAVIVLMIGRFVIFKKFDPLVIEKKPLPLSMALMYGLVLFALPLSLILPIPTTALYLYLKTLNLVSLPFPLFHLQALAAFSLIITIVLLAKAQALRQAYKVKAESLKTFGKLSVLGNFFTLLGFLMISVVGVNHEALRNGLYRMDYLHLVGRYFSQTGIIWLCLLASALIAQGFYWLVKTKQFAANDETDQTTGNFGTAAFATKKDIERMQAYSKEKPEAICMGQDMQGRDIYLPLMNKLTIAPPGFWKTTASSIPVLLSHQGPAFVFDPKGELWAVTARFRQQVLRRKVITLDPYGLTRSKDFRAGKPKDLLKEYFFNPFDWVPEDKALRDRMINTFAASFIINESNYTNHFDENAKILIRGYIDYIMTLSKEERTLAKLHTLMSESTEKAISTFEAMAKRKGSRAEAAANQISRVGADERGSILSTSYRQIDWMGDSNVQRTLSHTNFKFQDFLEGNMDIYVILPADQIAEHSRLFRMIMSLLVSMIVRANPSDLPKQKMLFLLEELAQLGYTPDVEKCIEILRASGVVVWAVFQSLSQIKIFKKPDLFTGIALKQVFTNDDVNTMQWIQTLGGKKTVVTESHSTNKGDSQSKAKLGNGSVSKGEGTNIQETGIDLIKLNEIRELPEDRQFIFQLGKKPILAKKVRYYEHPDFAGKFDVNPLEQRN